MANNPIANINILEASNDINELHTWINSNMIESTIQILPIQANNVYRTGRLMRRLFLPINDPNTAHNTLNPLINIINANKNFMGSWLPDIDIIYDANKFRSYNEIKTWLKKDVIPVVNETTKLRHEHNVLTARFGDFANEDDIRDYLLEIIPRLNRILAYKTIPEFLLTKITPKLNDPNIIKSFKSIISKAIGSNKDRVWDGLDNFSGAIDRVIVPDRQLDNIRNDLINAIMNDSQIKDIDPEKLNDILNKIEKVAIIKHVSLENLKKDMDYIKKILTFQNLEKN